jgi:hypothetical protein
MIAILPTNDPGRVLRLLVEYPGELRAEDCARHVWAPPRRPVPYRDAADRRAWLHLVDEHQRESAAKAARIIGRLQEAGLVARMDGVHVAAWFLEDARARGYRAALVRALPTWPAPVASVDGLLGVVHAVEKSPGWRAGTTAKERQYARLVASGILIAPGQRAATAKGVELVRSWAAEEKA